MKPAKILFLVSLCAALHADTIPPERVYGRAFIEVVRAATVCEAQRISVEYQPTRNDSSVLKITPKEELHVLPPESLGLLKHAFLRRPEAHRATKFCMPTPGIQYVFRSKSASTSILVCYKCRMAVVELGGKIIAQDDLDDVIADLRRVAESFLSPTELATLP